ncbi:polyisoprenoid-binding protein [Helicobacter didelphidarum]|uniref:Polyisoprenoid-binding protein n=1 Tax=Helicobacter didelphidarum TaxID=2040648 RepID=A0A3D8INX4_9HELI|nr:YceI family protein [Helicobacter didelphidarum]RDU66997.1 polyisoprenoid-binding protein [Helicobacter didelphidarum]
MVNKNIVNIAVSGIAVSGILSIFMFSNIALSAELDTSKTKTTWTAYKFYDKTPVSGTFGDIQYTWNKSGENLTDVLLGAKAVVNVKSVDLQDEVKNANVRDGFFALFKKQTIVATINKIVPDSVDKNKGRLELTIEMNGVKPIPVWMPYAIKGGNFVANGVIDFYDFKLNSALKKLSEVCESVHNGKTWSEAMLTLEIPIKKN